MNQKLKNVRPHWPLDYLAWKQRPINRRCQYVDWRVRRNFEGKRKSHSLARRITRTAFEAKKLGSSKIEWKRSYFIGPIIVTKITDLKRRVWVSDPKTKLNHLRIEDTNCLRKHQKWSKKFSQS